MAQRNRTELLSEVEQLQRLLMQRDRSLREHKNAAMKAMRRVAELEHELEAARGADRPRSDQAAGVPGSPSMAASLAHELNRPLSSIAMATRTCARGLKGQSGIDPDFIEMLLQAAAEAERAVEIVRGLRQLAVGGSPRRTNFNLGDLIRDTVDQLCDLIRAGQTQLRVEIHPELGQISADRVQIGQILVNLIRNSIEAMGETPIDQRVLEVRACRKGAEVEVSVRDQGSGLSVDIVERLFEPYQTTKPHGMGLGLALCRSILQAHAGRLWVKPNADRGTTFHFALPTSHLHP